MKTLTQIDDLGTLLQGHEGRVNSISGRRIQNPLVCQPQLNSMARAYLRDLRAAEMIAWQLTGGDYLISGWKPENS